MRALLDWSSGRRVVPARRERITAFTAYASLSVALFGRGVVGDPSGAVVGSMGGADQGVFIWSFGWWPHAITTGANPLLTDRVLAPDTWNLAWTSVIPGPALLAWPITALFGPIVSFNLIALLAPALAAYWTYRLCRAFELPPASSLLGGLVFGFGSYEASQMLNHLNLALVFPFPLLAFLVVRHVRGGSTTRAFVTQFAVAFALLGYCFLELLVSFLLFGIIALVVALVLAPGTLRGVIARSGGLAVSGCVLGTLFLAPYLLVALQHQNTLLRQLVGSRIPVDLANLMTPTLATQWHATGMRHAAELAGNSTEQAAFVGPAVALLVLLALAARFRSRLAWGCLLLGASSLVAALGPKLTVANHRRGVTLPWTLIDDLPLVKHAIPARFVVVMWLALATLLALALSQTPRVVGIAAALIVIVTLSPSLNHRTWTTPVDTPAFFEADHWRSAIEPNDIVLVIPSSFRGNSMLWQASADYSFRLTNGYVAAPIPTPIWNSPIGRAFYGQALPPYPDADSLAFLRDRCVDDVVVRDGELPQWSQLFDRVLGRGRHAGGVTAWRVTARNRC